MHSRRNWATRATMTQPTDRPAIEWAKQEEAGAALALAPVQTGTLRMADLVWHNAKGCVTAPASAVAMALAAAGA
jgi:hypothetical protein